MEDFNRMPPTIGTGTSPTSPPILPAGLIAPPSADDTPEGWNQSGFPRRESAATVESTSTMVESNYSGASPSKEGKEHMFKSDDGLSGSDDGRPLQIGYEGSLEDGGGRGVESGADDTRTVLSMRVERVGGVSTFKTIAGIVCVIGGTGMLGIPRSVAEAGWLGSLLIVLALFMSTYTGHILIECLYLKTILGVCATIGVVSITVGMSVKMLLTHTAATVTATHKLINWGKLPLALATISFAYGGNVVYPHVEQSMRYPRQWTKALWIALTTCFVMYITIALSGYAAFGHETLSPILRNLPSGALSITANSLITVHVLLAAPILLTSLSMMIEHSIAERIPTFAKGSSFSQFVKRAIPRTAIMFITGLIAGVVPFFGDVMDLLGSLTQCLLVFVMPIVFFYKLGGLDRAAWWTKLWAAFVLVVGMIALILGTVDAIRHLAADFRHK
ncbi:hypothetical protein BGZ96_005077 [Linnemannia gamsii]|uniref:Amino acid transporter transmembrane domain-containing protein n=1 Tax=Linnemannia gamsii TaxID=64522 RepID=A0ABQ7K4N7_9FUNG|nr:hypothetical protein BGZ96_005077 [Linnemannia gamsii]